MTNTSEETWTQPGSANETIKYAGICFAIFATCYGYEIANFNLSIDEEILAFSEPNWFTIGRWALQLVTATLWPTPTTPFGPFVIFGLFGSISYIILLKAFDVSKPRLSHFIIFPLFIAFPVWFTQVEFSSNIIGCGISLLLVSIALLFSKDVTFLKKALATAAITIAVGIYQSFVFLYIVLGAAACLHAYTNKESLTLYLKSIVSTLTIASTAFLLSIALSKLLMWMLHLEQSDYASSFLKFNELFDHPLDVLVITVEQIKKIYFTYWSDFGFSKYIFALIIFFGTTTLLLNPRTRRSVPRFLVTLFSLTIIGIAPFSLNPFMGGELPVRTFVAIPTSVWLFALLPIASHQRKKTELFVIAIGILAFIQILYIQSLVQARSWAVRQHDILLANSIYNKIIELNNSSDITPIKLEISGTIRPSPPYPLLWSATSGASFFEWDSGNKYRMIAFMKLIGFNRIVPATKDECTELIPELYLMPSWPAAGSVKLIRDIILVKLSNDQPITCK